MGTDAHEIPEDWNGRSLTSLIEHIIETHHAFCKRELTRLSALFKDVVESHGKEHPELQRVRTIFFQMGRDLSMHLLKEEQTLFPYIARVEEAVSQKAQITWPPFGTVENPIRIMVLEHNQADKEIEEMRKLSKEYKPPADASDRYTELYNGLAAFDDDMRRHVDLENNLLFPRAVAMEKEACLGQKTAGD